MDQEPKTARDVMEEAKRELEEQSRLQVSTPQEPAEEDDVPTHVIETPQPTPQEVIEEEGLGVK